MLYLYEVNNKYYFPDDIWNIIKEYTGIYHIACNYNDINMLTTGSIYTLYRNWFGRFIISDYYDYWNNDERKKWLLKNLVNRDNYLMNKDKYEDMFYVLNN
tara:strand:+ start:8407 stop:8709 length:303 start_codon:yes stop_codon:yes gene_type:complete